MKWELATDKQILTIFSSDHDCPPPLLEGMVVEMMKRKLLNGIIFYSAKQAYNNVIYVLERILKIDDEELVQIAHIHIIKRLKGFKPGTRTVKTYLIMCLISKFTILLRDSQMEKRISNVHTQQVDSLPEYLQSRIFRSSGNVEKQVVDKIMVEEALTHLREIERKAILLELMGYQHNEIKTMLGYHPNGNLITKAHNKLKKYLEA
jgi:RNA polymerase sigma factor (sigma-70 family)